MKHLLTAMVCVLVVQMTMAAPKSKQHARKPSSEIVIDLQGVLECKGKLDSGDRIFKFNFDQGNVSDDEQTFFKCSGRQISDNILFSCADPADSVAKYVIIYDTKTQKAHDFSLRGNSVNPGMFELSALVCVKK